VSYHFSGIVHVPKTKKIVLKKLKKKYERAECDITEPFPFNRSTATIKR